MFVYVQHLLGIGHLKRAAAVARAISATGSEVTLVSGGMPVPGVRCEGIEFIQLPPAVSADSTFKVLLDIHGRPVDERWREERRAKLLGAWKAARPHALVVELYPFGRRQMRFELEPLLDAVRSETHRPIVVCSVRDILGGGQKNPARQEEMLAAFERYFDELLVHSDPALVPFERTFLQVARLGSRLHYTGYVVDEPVQNMGRGASFQDGEREILVSAGGGMVGHRLLDAAIRARPLSAHAERTWRILAGVNMEPAQFGRLVQLAGQSGQGRVIVEPTRSDFADLLANCQVSVSQGGYNTVMEIVRLGARAVVVPFSGGNETEQELRATLLAERGLIQKLDEAELNPSALAQAVDRAAGRPRPSAGSVDLNGARRSAEFIARWMQELKW